LDFLRDFFNALSVPEVHGLIAKAPRGLIPMPLLLIWAGLLGQGELLARGPWCRETALPRSSSSAQRRRAGGSDPHGERRGEERGVGGSWEWEGAESCLQEKPAQPLTR